jgi:hypothetical protein
MAKKPRKPAAPVQTFPAPVGVPAPVLVGLANLLADIAPGLWDRPHILAYGPGPLDIERWLRCPDVQARVAEPRHMPAGVLATIVTCDPSHAALKAAAELAHIDGCATLLVIAPRPVLEPLNAAGWKYDGWVGFGGYCAAVCVRRVN